MSHTVNDQIMENIYEDVMSKIEALDEDMHQRVNETSFHTGLHPDDDIEAIVEYIVNEEWEAYPEGPM
tara:strand:+ start:125 stop:328 length:204 start_codon:yes stop_codon:yes gene_type:complete